MGAQRPMRNVLITGGAGYVGHVLTPRLLSEGYHVTVYDQLFFGCRLPNHANLRVIKGDIRDAEKVAEALQGQDAVLHLACISNDASFELDEKLSETINYDCFEPIVIAAKKAGVQRFVYCSSSSVYGVSDSPIVGHVLRARAGTNATGRIYRAVGKTSFSEAPVKYDMFMSVLDGLKAFGAR
jgi:nucleoside-diphosphate-sugar epimerase